MPVSALQGLGRRELREMLAETLKAVKTLGKRSYVNVICFESSIHAWNRKMTPQASRRIQEPSKAL